VRKSGNTLTVLFSAIFIFALPGCGKSTVADHRPNPIVGAWVVKDAGAPFPYHMYVFNADGTMQQANPDAGDPRTSDSDGKGIWVTDGDKIKGKWAEVTADRTTRQFVSRGEISYEIVVNGDTLNGTLTARSYDANDTLIDGPTRPSRFEGKRVTLP
jgi:hypothetical protein